MEIPTEETIEKLNKLIVKDGNGQVTTAAVQTKLDAIKLIKDQAREIIELQKVIVNIREDNQKLRRLY